MRYSFPRNSRTSKIFVAGSLALAFCFVLSLPQAEARHHHRDVPDENSTQVVEEDFTRDNAEVMHPVLRQGRADLQRRVDAAMHPAPADLTAPVQNAMVPPTVSAYDDSILGTPLASEAQCVDYLLSANPNPEISVTPQQLVSYYYEEGEREGVRPDVAFAQACKETGFFRYGGTVTPDQNNYCGLGTTSATVKGAYFASAQLGVRAHIQHLLAYATTRAPQEPVVDPRYDLVRSSYGANTLSRWEDLNGRWAVPGYTYGQSILSMFRAMLQK